MGLIKDVTEKIKNIGQPAIPEAAVLDALRVVQDPDLHKDIVTLGFVKNLQIKGNSVAFVVELTTPACPVKEQLKEQCEQAVSAIPGVGEVKVTMSSRTRGRGMGSAEGVAALAHVKNIIAVASGKGGVGKSTTAVNVAFALAETGAKVGLLDADVYGPSVPLMTKVANPTHTNAQGQVVPPTVQDVKIISAAMFSSGKAMILRGPMAGNMVKQLLTQVEWGELDYLIIDYPPGTGDIQLSLSQSAPITGVVIVTTPQDVALLDVRKAVNMFETVKVPVLGIIETMSYFICDGCSKKHTIFRSGGGKKLSVEFGVPFLGEIPMEEVVVNGGDEGVPLIVGAPKSASAHAYRQSAKAAAQQISLIHQGGNDALTEFSLTWQN